MSEQLITAQLEALLFVFGEPIKKKKIASVLGVTETVVEEGIAALGEALRDEGRGLMLVEEGDAVQLVTKPAFGALLETIIKSEFTENLTPAALETLSIICYTAPTTRAEIDYIRGVNSSFILRSLTIRGLVDRKNDPQRGNAYVYSPSFELLKHIGVSRTEELPEFETFHGLVRKFTEGNEAVTEAPVDMNEEHNEDVAPHD